CRRVCAKQVVPLVVGDPVGEDRQLYGGGRWLLAAQRLPLVASAAMNDFAVLRHGVGLVGEHDVVAGAAVDNVLGAVGNQIRVVAGPPVELVLAGPAGQAVVTRAAEDGVVALPPLIVSLPARPLITSFFAVPVRRSSREVAAIVCGSGTVEGA